MGAVVVTAVMGLAPPSDDSTLVRLLSRGRSIMSLNCKHTTEDTGVCTSCTLNLCALACVIKTSTQLWHPSLTSRRSSTRTHQGTAAPVGAVALLVIGRRAKEWQPIRLQGCHSSGYAYQGLASPNALSNATSHSPPIGSFALCIDT